MSLNALNQKTSCECGASGRVGGRREGGGGRGEEGKEGGDGRGRGGMGEGGRGGRRGMRRLGKAVGKEEYCKGGDRFRGEELKYKFLVTEMELIDRLTVI